MNDLDIIKQIEQEINKKLPQISLDKITNFLNRENGYAVDENNNVIGLNLDKLELINIPEPLVLLKKLENLSIVGNKIEKLPASFGQLQNLSDLNLEENQLKELPASLLELRNLQKLCLNNNEFNQLSKKILDLNLELYWIDCEDLYGIYGEEKESGIAVGDNPLTSPPPEVIKQGQQAIIDYFNALEDETEKPLNEIKVLLVGDGGVGKTSLVKRLLGQDFNPHEAKTHGINIKPFNITIQKDTQVKTNLWDFGGQQIMHATHQFFLSKRSLYILVLDSREEEDPEYWLKHIESFGGDSPILIVLNKIDDNPSFEVNQPFLREKYTGIHSFHRVSCKKSTGIKTLKTAISKALCEVEMLQTLWPTSWFEIKNELENLDYDYISHDFYQNLCKQQQITNTAQKTLVNYLHDLGVIVHFDKFDLQDTYVLQPKWVTEAVYKIINSEQLADNKGILKLNCLNDILQPIDENDYCYPLDKQPFIVRLMEEFELCYRIENEDTILIPDLLAVAEPENLNFDYHNALQFKLEYDFLPRAIMPKFIVKRHKDILNQLRWRTGVVLFNSNYQATALIKADNKDSHIQIWVSGQQKRDYFATVRNTLWDIHNTFEKLDIKELIPLPDKDKRNETVYVDYEELIGHYLDNEETYYNGILRKRYNVKQLLDGIEDMSKKENKESNVTHNYNFGDMKNSNFSIGENNKQSIKNSFFR
jgi:small GTP-binding protein